MDIQELLHSVEDYKLYIFIGLYALFVFLAFKKKTGAAILFGALMAWYCNQAYAKEINKYIYDLTVIVYKQCAGKVDDGTFMEMAKIATVILQYFPFWGTLLIVRIIRRILNAIKKARLNYQRHQQELKRQREDAKRKAKIAEAEKRISEVKGQMETLQGYELNIVPFMELLNREGAQNKLYSQKVSELKKHAVSLAQQRDSINHQAEELSLRARINIHYK